MFLESFLSQNSPTDSTDESFFCLVRRTSGISRSAHAITRAAGCMPCYAATRAVNSCTPSSIVPTCSAVYSL